MKTYQFLNWNILQIKSFIQEIKNNYFCFFETITTIKSLDKLVPGEKGIINEFESTNLPMKLIEMGCLPGIEIEVLYLAPYNDPIYLKVNGTHLALRKDLASKIYIDLIK